MTSKHLGSIDIECAKSVRSYMKTVQYPSATRDPIVSNAPQRKLGSICATAFEVHSPATSSRAFKSGIRYGRMAPCVVEPGRYDCVVSRMHVGIRVVAVKALTAMNPMTLHRREDVVDMHIYLHVFYIDHAQLISAAHQRNSVRLDQRVDALYYAPNQVP